MFSTTMVVCIMVTTIGLCCGQTEFEWKETSDQEYDYEGELVFCSWGENLYGYYDGNSPNRDCQSPGPMLQVEAGARYKLTLRNAHPDASVVTNLHTHGLHISGSGNSDDVTRSVSSGKCLGINITIDASHCPGTYWYHAHLHGVTRAQTSGGAYGFLIVKETNFAGVLTVLPQTMDLV